MAPRQARSHNEGSERQTPGGADGSSGGIHPRDCVLVVHPQQECRQRLVEAIESSGRPAVAVGRLSAVASVLRERRVGPVLVAGALAVRAMEVLRRPAQASGAVLVCERGDVSAARTMVETGCVDCVEADASPEVICAAVARADAALRTPRHDPAQERTRERRLLEICKRLNESRRALTSELLRVCEETARSHEELASQIDSVAICGEFTGLIRQELELESLMRTALEFILAKLGATNAAMFLPSSSGDWTLGAYVNYDRPRETAEMLFDHLTDVVPDAIVSARGVLDLRDASQVRASLANVAEWIDDCAVLAAGAWHEDEPLAGIMLFRDRRTPFAPHMARTLESLSRILASQLARVIRVHHRHLPKEQWGAPGDPLPPTSSDSCDEDDLLA